MPYVLHPHHESLQIESDKRETTSWILQSKVGEKVTQIPLRIFVATANSVKSLDPRLEYDAPFTNFANPNLSFTIIAARCSLPVGW